MSPKASTFSLFRRYFWKPPRAHGDVIEDRSVSFLELFYDLVYVVVIARVAHTLTDYVRFPDVYQPLSWSLMLAALASVLVGALRPAPWLLALILVAVLSLVWLFAIGLWVKTGDPDAQVPATD